MITPYEPQEGVTRLLMRNAATSAITLVREPLGDQFEMAPGATLEVVSRGPSSETLSVNIQARGVTLWAERQAHIQIFRDGTEVFGR